MEGPTLASVSSLCVLADPASASASQGVWLPGCGPLAPRALQADLSGQIK